MVIISFMFTEQPPNQSSFVRRKHTASIFLVSTPNLVEIFGLTQANFLSSRLNLMDLFEDIA